MAINTSDQAGRALEYIIVKEIINYYPHTIILGCTIRDQSRDESKFLNIDHIQQAYYLKSAIEIINWIERKFDASNAKVIKLERLPDNAARNGNVTDISLIIDDKAVNLSLKHNHTALKHQRPPSTAIQCGFAKKSNEDKNYREAHKVICETFLQKARALKSGITLFSEIKQLVPNFIDDEIYYPVCVNITNFLNNNASNYPHAQNYFTFLAGNTDYYKVIVRPGYLEIMEFADMPLVNSLVAKLHNKSYINVSFSNGWNIAMRLHTASSKMAGVSLKFDTQPIELNIPKEIISL